MNTILQFEDFLAALPLYIVIMYAKICEYLYNGHAMLCMNYECHKKCCLLFSVYSMWMCGCVYWRILFICIMCYVLYMTHDQNYSSDLYQKFNSLHQYSLWIKYAWEYFAKISLARRRWSEWHRGGGGGGVGTSKRMINKLPATFTILCTIFARKNNIINNDKNKLWLVNVKHLYSRIVAYSRISLMFKFQFIVEIKQNTTKTYITLGRWVRDRGRVADEKDRAGERMEFQFKHNNCVLQNIFAPN